MLQSDAPPLRRWLDGVAGPPRHFWGARGSVAFTDLIAGSSFGGRLGAFQGRSVLVATSEQLTAALGHAYASTEAGVGFEVDDGLEGFPAHFVDGGNRDVDIRIVGTSLRLRSARTASRYIGAGVSALMDSDGFVDTGDIVERRGERYYFVGRKDGIINVGGLKVHPEEVEAAINRHAGVCGSLVKSRKSPITGAIVVADVVLKASPDGADAGHRLVALEREIIDACRRDLAPYKVPAVIRFVPALPMSATGKLVRHA
jgi:acyl-CoA synthetase (AMP-forming)/AMP-acid ligase II